jgi:hypothetical protein
MFFSCGFPDHGHFPSTYQDCVCQQKKRIGKNMQIGRDDIPSKAPGSYLLTGDLALAQ